MKDMDMFGGATGIVKWELIQDDDWYGGIPHLHIADDININFHGLKYVNTYYDNGGSTNAIMGNIVQPTLYKYDFMINGGRSNEEHTMYRLGTLFEAINRVKLTRNCPVIDRWENNIPVILEWFRKIDCATNFKSYMGKNYEDISESELKSVYTGIVVLQENEFKAITENKRVNYKHMYYDEDMNRFEEDCYLFGNSIVLQLSSGYFLFSGVVDFKDDINLLLAVKEILYYSEDISKIVYKGSVTRVE